VSNAADQTALAPMVIVAAEQHEPAVGASANVVMLGIARTSNHPISFWEFTRKGAIVTAVSIALSAIYLWVRYFVAG
jgi:hypothetical protein